MLRNKLHIDHANEFSPKGNYTHAGAYGATG